MSALLFAALTLALATGTAFGQSGYPQRQVTMVIPTTVGTAADITARNFAPKLAQKFGRAFVVDNRTGASGNIAVSNVVKAPPDGHTILVTASTLAVSPFLSKGVDWDPLRDLQPVALLSAITYVLLVHPSQPVNSVKELVALAQQRPGQLNYSSPGTGTPHHLIMEMFKLATGANITHIPYKGTAPALTDLVGGRVETAFFPVHTANELARGGKLRMIGSLGERRTPWTPELPTLPEQGVNGIDVDVWVGVFAPAGTPRDIVATLSNEFIGLMNAPENRDMLFSQGIVARTGGPDVLSRTLKADMERFRKVIAEANIKSD
ncbi:MAG TPA: tripartite tricarboxylate transporter substrate binding protein [Burkholderiales bacterium]|nr:tripartite tricarboxylate transporter substrate binding protein [Burkholderiales bacterium]